MPLGLILLLALVACTPRLGDTEAALALEDIAAGSGYSRLKAQTPAPQRRTLEYSIEGRRYTADLYQSPAGTRAGIVLVPGVVPAGKDDGRLVALANTLARLNLAVLVPDLQGLRRYRVRQGDVREVADAFRYLRSRPEWVPQGHAGIAGFSYGAGPVLLAALEPGIREQVRFIMTLGGYYDLRSIVTYFTTGYYRESTAAPWRYREPHPYIKWVFTLSNADLVEHSGDRAALHALGQRFLGHDMSDTEPAMPKLHPDAQALYALLTNTDPARVNALIERLSPRVRDELTGLNPAAQDLTQLRARAILVHGRGDTMIPYTESMALAAALPPGQAQLFLIEGLAHVDIQPQQQDIPQLLAAMEVLLAQRVTAGP
jgi:pimeloyl-ACP methyl ester carboxylesterase